MLVVLVLVALEVALVVTLEAVAFDVAFVVVLAGGNLKIESK